MKKGNVFGPTVKAVLRRIIRASAGAAVVPEARQIRNGGVALPNGVAATKPRQTVKEETALWKDDDA